MSGIEYNAPAGAGVGGSATATYTNVKDFGATGDGTTDDTNAVKDAVTALPTDGGVLYFPPGTYIVAPETGAGATIKPQKPITILGAGPGISIVKTKGGVVTDDGVDWRLTRLVGKTTVRDISFYAPDTLVTDGDLTAILVDDAAGTEVSLFNVETKRFNFHIRNTSGYTNTPKINVVNCKLDGGSIGLQGGSDQVIRSFGINAPDATKLFVTGTVFDSLGSNEPVDGANHHHCIYVSNDTPFIITNNRFLNHIDGRHIQFNGAMSVPSTQYNIIKGNYFGPYQVTGNNCVQTAYTGITLIEGNVFQTGDTTTAPTSDLVIDGPVRILDNLFIGDGPALGGFHVSTVADADNDVIEIRGNTFKGDRAQAVRISSSTNMLTVTDNYFTNNMLAHVRLEGTATDAVFSQNRFKATAGDQCIRVASGTHARLRANDNEFNGGACGIQIDAGVTVSLFYTRDNEFVGQTTAAITKTGTVTTESAKGNIGYADV